jgi:phospholipase C
MTSDPNAIPGVFKQTGGQDGNVPNPDGYTLPWHMDTGTTDAQSTGELDHSWGPQHAMWNQGLMDNFLAQGIADTLRKEVLDRTLPQVAWIVGPAETTEHPDYTPGRGAQFIDQILEALTADLDVWAKTLLIINYDENDGHFDHVLPPTAPPGQSDEYVAGQPIGLQNRRHRRPMDPKPLC